MLLCLFIRDRIGGMFGSLRIFLCRNPTPAGLLLASGRLFGGLCGGRIAQTPILFIAFALMSMNSQPFVLIFVMN